MILADNKLKLAFYRAKFGNNVDGFINAFSGFGGFSHTELVFPDGSSFSSTTRDASVDPQTGLKKPDGTRWTMIDFDPFKWSIYTLPASADQVQGMANYANTLLSSRYDYKGVMRFIPVIGILARESPDKYFCSEACVEVCQEGGGMFNTFEAHLISPNRWAKFLGVK